jgi:hypothetical protein
LVCVEELADSTLYMSLHPCHLYLKRYGKKEKGTGAPMIRHYTENVWSLSYMEVAINFTLWQHYS